MAQAAVGLQCQQKLAFLSSGVDPFQYLVALGQTHPGRSKRKILHVIEMHGNCLKWSERAYIEMVG